MTWYPLLIDPKMKWWFARTLWAGIMSHKVLSGGGSNFLTRHFGATVHWRSSGRVAKKGREEIHRKHFWVGELLVCPPFAFWELFVWQRRTLLVCPPLGGHFCTIKIGFLRICVSNCGPNSCFFVFFLIFLQISHFLIVFSNIPKPFFFQRPSLRKCTKSVFQKHYKIVFLKGVYSLKDQKPGSLIAVSTSHASICHENRQCIQKFLPKHALDYMRRLRYQLTVSKHVSRLKSSSLIRCALQPLIMAYSSSFYHLIQPISLSTSSPGSNRKGGLVQPVFQQLSHVQNVACPVGRWQLEMR